MGEKNSKRKFRGEIVKKDNILNEGVGTLDTAEKYKLMLLMIAQISTQDNVPVSPEDIAGRTYSFYIDDYVELKKVKDKYFLENYVIDMANYLKNNSVITLVERDKNGELVRYRTVWIFEDVDFQKTKRGWKVLYRFTYTISKFLFELKSRFFSYHIKNIMPMRSKYSIRLYELLKQYEKIGERTFDIDEFREEIWARTFIIDKKTGEKRILEDNYKKFKDLKRWVIEKAVEEVNKYSDIEITDVEYIKRGKGGKVVYITFRFKPKINFDFYKLDELQQKVDTEKKEVLDMVNNKDRPVSVEIFWKNIGEIRKQYKSEIDKIMDHINYLKGQKSLGLLKSNLAIHDLSENQVLFLLINADREIYDTDMIVSIIIKAITNKKIDNIVGFLITALNIDLENAKFKELLNVDKKLDEEILEEELALIEEEEKDRNREIFTKYPRIPDKKVEKIIGYIFSKIIPDLKNDENFYSIVEYMIKNAVLDKENKVLYIPVQKSVWIGWYDFNLREDLERLLKVKTKLLEV